MNIQAPFLIVIFGLCFFLFRIVKSTRTQNLILLIISLLVYFFYAPIWFFYLLLVISISYYSGVLIYRAPNVKRKICRNAALVIIISLLAFFKYEPWLAGYMDSIFNIGALPMVIYPIGASFFSFKAISYIMDVYNGKNKNAWSFEYVALYISFLPQIVAGPITKSYEFYPQLVKRENASFDSVNLGLFLILKGLIKKIVIADRLAVCVDAVYSNPTVYDSGTVIIAIITYSFQLYFDFSGYSDFSIGVCRILGFDIRNNFDYPYISRSFSEFWKRWHISLSEWLQEYVYFPLGGNRKGRIRTYINLLITMLIGGIWHGSTLNFLIWGGCHGVLLVVHKIWMKHNEAFKENTVYNIASTVLTFLGVTILWVFFRCNSLKQAFLVLRSAFNGDGVHYYYIYSLLFIPCYILFEFLIYKGRKKGFDYYKLIDLKKYTGQIVMFILLLFVIGFAYIGGNEFIYAGF